MRYACWGRCLPSPQHEEGEFGVPPADGRTAGPEYDQPGFRLDALARTGLIRNPGQVRLLRTANDREVRVRESGNTSREQEAIRKNDEEMHYENRRDTDSVGSPVF